MKQIAKKSLSLLIVIISLGNQPLNALSIHKYLQPRVTQLAQNPVEVLFDHSLEKTLRGDLTGAIGDLTEIIRFEPNNAVAYNNRGVLYMRLQQNEKALADYGKAIEIDQHYPEAYNNRGYFYLQLKQYDQALFDLSKAIEINPLYSEPYATRGLVYASLNQYDQAVSDLSKAIEINPTYAEAYLSRGLIYQKWSNSSLCSAEG